MAKVLVTIKVFPDDIETDLKELLGKIKESLPEEYEVIRYREEPIAFGLKALVLYISIPEETAGGTETLEKTIKDIEGVSQVEVEMVTRI